MAGSSAPDLVFLLIGSAMATIDFAREGWLALALTVLLALAGRAVAVYPVCLAFAYTRWAVPLNQQHLLWWGGLRGALALALALALPPHIPLEHARLRHLRRTQLGDLEHVGATNGRA